MNVAFQVMSNMALVISNMVYRPRFLPENINTKDPDKIPCLQASLDNLKLPLLHYESKHKIRRLYEADPRFVAPRTITLGQWCETANMTIAYMQKPIIKHSMPPPIKKH